MTTQTFLRSARTFLASRKLLILAWEGVEKHFFLSVLIWNGSISFKHLDGTEHFVPACQPFSWGGSLERLLAVLEVIHASIFSEQVIIVKYLGNICSKAVAVWLLTSAFGILLVLN